MNSLEYLRKIGDFSGDNFTVRLQRNVFLLVSPFKLILATEERFKRLILTEGAKFLKVLVDGGICTRDTECSLIGVNEILAC